MGSSIHPAWGGTAVVCCVHDREKRQVTTDLHVARLAAIAGFIYDERQHKIHRCACCDNLFVDPTDIPRYCHVCRKSPVHALAGPLPPSIGVIDG